jgi:MbtH protein
MTSPFDDENGEYHVLINDEGQYSLWPTYMTIPLGWARVGPTGARQQCLAYIEEHWTDMRPKSLIERMKVADREPPASATRD